MELADRLRYILIKKHVIVHYRLLMFIWVYLSAIAYHQEEYIVQGCLVFAVCVTFECYEHGLEHYFDADGFLPKIWEPVSRGLADLSHAFTGAICMIVHSYIGYISGTTLLLTVLHSVYKHCTKPWPYADKKHYEYVDMHTMFSTYPPEQDNADNV